MEKQKTYGIYFRGTDPHSSEGFWTGETCKQGYNKLPILTAHKQLAQQYTSKSHAERAVRALRATCAPRGIFELREWED